MSWQQWPTGLPPASVLPLVNSAPPVINPTQNSNMQYTPEQWQQMQQQNWQQWAQWQQQYQQWHQQYGAEYQKSLNAMAGASTTPAPPPANTGYVNTSAPPPLPPEIKPPPPPDEPPTTTTNYYTTAPPANATTSYNTNNQTWKNQNMSVPPPIINNQSKQETPSSDFGGKRPFPNQNNFQDIKRNKYDQEWQTRNRAPTSVPPQQPVNKAIANQTLEELTETEKKFMKQFAEWEAQFNKWKEQNEDHPDKEQYKEYEKKWETWRNQLLDRREQMRRRRLGLTGASISPQPNSIQTKPAPSVSHTTLMQNRTISNENLGPNINKPPPHLNNEPLQFKTNNSEITIPVTKKVIEDDIEIIENERNYEDSNSFLRSNTSGGIPGLDLVESSENKDESNDHTINKQTDFEALSKNINSILGDQKLLSMLSMVTKNQKPFEVSKDSSIKADVGSNDLSRNSFMQEEDSRSKQSWNDFDNGKQSLPQWEDNDYARSEKGNEYSQSLNYKSVDNYNRFSSNDDKTTLVGQEHNIRNMNEPFNNQMDFNTKSSEQLNRGPNFSSNKNLGPINANFMSNSLKGPENFQGNSFRPNENFKDIDDSFKTTDNKFREPNLRDLESNIRSSEGNFRGPDGYSRTLENGFRFESNPDGNFRGADNFRGSDGNFRGPNANFRMPEGNFRVPDGNLRGPDGNLRGPDENFRALDGNLRGSDGNFRGLDGHFRGLDGDSRGTDGNIRGPDGHLRGLDGNFRAFDGNLRGSDENLRGPGGNLRGLDGNFRAPDGNLRTPDGNLRASDGHLRGLDGNFRAPDGNLRGPDGNFRAPDGNLRGSDGNFRAPDANFREVEENFRGPSGNFRGSGGNLRGQDEMFRGHDNYSSSDIFRSPEKKFRGPDGNNRESENNFRGPSGLFKDEENFRGSENNLRGAVDGNLRGPENSFRSQANISRPDRNFLGFVNSFAKSDIFKNNDKFSGPDSRVLDGFRSKDNFRGPENLSTDNRGSIKYTPSDIITRTESFENHDETNADYQGSYDEQYMDIDYNDESGNWDKSNSNFPHDEDNWDDEYPTEDPFSSECNVENVPNIANESHTMDDILSIEKVVNYDHKTKKPAIIEVTIDPPHTFDYRHKSVNRIPIPGRPKWLSATFRNLPEFEPSLGRLLIPTYSRYPIIERFNYRSGPSQVSQERHDDYNKYNRRPQDERSNRNRRYVDERKHYDKSPQRDFDHRKSPNLRDQEYKNRRENFNRNTNTTDKFISNNKKPSNIFYSDDIFNSPGRLKRAPKIIIILRGPPGSGKTYLAKLMKDKEMENGGSAPRILSLEDYFMVEQEKEIMEDGKQVKIKEMVYEYEECMEQSYKTSLSKSFRKTVTDGYFSFIIVDDVNDKIKHFNEMWSFGRENGFQVYICQLEFDLQTCSKRNIHGRTEESVKKLINCWEETPSHFYKLDATNLIQAASIPEVEMEEINSPNDNFDDEHEEQPCNRSKWDNFECSINNLAKLDGINKPLRSTRTMEDYLQLEEWTARASSKPGQKRVRWADLEECKKQEKMRAIGFVVGQTDWDRMMDPTQGSSALTQTKFIERVHRY